MTGEPTAKKGLPSHTGKVEASSVVAAGNHLSTDLGDEVVILHLESGKYYGLDEVGVRVWNLIQEPKSVAALREAISSEYDVDATRCEQDLVTLLQALADRDLVEIRSV